MRSRFSKLGPSRGEVPGAAVTPLERTDHILYSSRVGARLHRSFPFPAYLMDRKENEDEDVRSLRSEAPSLYCPLIGLLD